MDYNQVEKILLVDDEPNVLAGYQRQLRKKRLQVETAVGGESGLYRIRNEGPYAVIVSDLKMPGVNGIQILAEAKSLSPLTVRIILTGYADINNAIESVNQGNVFRFLLKPCPPEALLAAIQDGLEQYRLLTSEKVLLEKTLSGSIQVMTEILALLHPEALGRSARLARLVGMMADQMAVTNKWALETAANLSQIGLVMMSPESLEKLLRCEQLVGEEKQLFDMHPFLTADLLKHIPRLESVAEIISYQEKHYDGGGIPIDGVAGEEIPLGSRMLKAASDFDMLTTAGADPHGALLAMADRTGTYDTRMLDAIAKVAQLREKWRSLEVTIDQLRDGMILSESILLSGGQMLVPAGQRVSELMIRRIRNFDQNLGVSQPIYVERK